MVFLQCFYFLRACTICYQRAVVAAQCTWSTEGSLSMETTLLWNLQQLDLFLHSTASLMGAPSSNVSPNIHTHSYIHTHTHIHAQVHAFLWRSVSISIHDILLFLSLLPSVIHANAYVRSPTCVQALVRPCSLICQLVSTNSKSYLWDVLEEEANSHFPLQS